MKKLASTLSNMVLSLGAVTAVAGTLLGLMYAVTKEPIAQQEKDAQITAIRTVAPPFNNDPEKQSDTVVTPDGTKCIIYPAILDGKLQGAAVKASTMQGFSGEVVIMCGFDLDGTVRDYRVLKQAETPGLGAKMETWFRDPTAARSVIGKNPGSISFYVTKDKAQHGAIDGITAATISSRAFLGAMRDAYQMYKEYADKKSNQNP